MCEHISIELIFHGTCSQYCYLVEHEGCRDLMATYLEDLDPL